MNKEQFLGASLPTGLYVFNEKLYGREVLKLNGLNFGDVIHQYGLSPQQYITPILRPLSDLTNPIVHNGETFVPILKLAEVLIDAKIKKETVTTVDEKTGWIGCEFWDIKSQRYLMCIFMPKYGLSIVDNEQNELMFSTINAIQMLIEWHFNLMDESEPFIPVTNDFNPYK